MQSSQSSPGSSSSQLAGVLEDQGVSVSAGMIRYCLHEPGLVYASPMAKPLLAEGHCQTHLKFTKQNTWRDWLQVLFTDETTLCLFATLQRVWWRCRIFVTRMVKHPLKIHVWGCFAASKFSRIFLFCDNLNVQFLVHIYEEALLPSALVLFGDS